MARFQFAQTRQTIGQKLYTLERDAVHSLLKWAEQLWQQGHSAVALLEVLMPS